MSLSVLVALLLCRNLIAQVPADMVSITASGAFHHRRVQETPTSKTVRRHSQSPDDDSLPFVLDGPAPAGTFRPLPATSPVATAFDDSPFMLDDGTAPKAPLPEKAESPFVVGSQLGPKPQTVFDTVAEVQKQASVVNDSPFVIDSEPSQAPSSQKENVKAPLDSAASPFLVDDAASKAEINEDDDREDQVRHAQLSEEVGKRGPLTIVRNGRPQPHTTEMIRNNHFGETTTASPSSTGLQFELEGSLLQTGSAQRFVSVPGTPFELDTHVLSSKQQQPKLRIELQRQIPSGSLSFNSLGPNTIMPSAPMPVMYPMNMVPVMNPANAFMQNTVLTNQAAPVAPQMGFRNQPGSPITAASPPQANAQGSNAAIVSAPRPPGQIAAKEKHVVADADVPLSTKPALNAPVVLPAPQVGPDAPTANSTAAKDNDKTAPKQNASSSISDAAASLGLNATNSTLKGHVPAKAVTIRGAIIAMFLGLVVTVFFLSAVLCMLHAGRKPPEESDIREPPRPTRSYRQLLKAQKPEASQSSTNVP